MRRLVELLDAASGIEDGWVLSSDLVDMVYDLKLNLLEDLDPYQFSKKFRAMHETVKRAARSLDHQGVAEVAYVSIAFPKPRKSYSHERWCDFKMVVRKARPGSDVEDYPID